MNWVKEHNMTCLRSKNKYIAEPGLFLSPWFSSSIFVICTIYNFFNCLTFKMPPLILLLRFICIIKTVRATNWNAEWGMKAESWKQKFLLKSSRWTPCLMQSSPNHSRHIVRDRINRSANSSATYHACYPQSSSLPHLNSLQLQFMPLFSYSALIRERTAGHHPPYNHTRDNEGGYWVTLPQFQSRSYYTDLLTGELTKMTSRTKHI